MIYRVKRRVIAPFSAKFEFLMVQRVCHETELVMEALQITSQIQLSLKLQLVRLREQSNAAIGEAGGFSLATGTYYGYFRVGIDIG